MLLDYKNDYEKISMGLLSFVPDLKDVSRLQDEMDWYQSKEDHKLYLWKSEDTQDIIAVIGVEIGNDMVLLRHISINPSFRNEGISYKILAALERQFPQKKIMGTLETASLIAKWENKKYEQHSLEADEKGED